MDNRYIEQYERVKRWFQRFKEISTTREHDMPTDYYQDVVYAFFQNCYHLKDWLISCGIPKEAIYNFIESSLPLKLSGDICVGSKHLDITDTQHHDPNSKISSRHFYLELGVPTSKIHVEYNIQGRGSDIDAFNLASQCMKEWERFFIQSDIPYTRK